MKDGWNKLWTLGLAVVASLLVGWSLAGRPDSGSELHAYNSTGNIVVIGQGGRVYIVNTESHLILAYEFQHGARKHAFLGGRRFDFDMELVKTKGEISIKQDGYDFPSVKKVASKSNP